jgi:hypothetical protein
MADTLEELARKLSLMIQLVATPQGRSLPAGVPSQDTCNTLYMENPRRQCIDEATRAGLHDKMLEIQQQILAARQTQPPVTHQPGNAVSSHVTHEEYREQCEFSGHLVAIIRLLLDSGVVIPNYVYIPRQMLNIDKLGQQYIDIQIAEDDNYHANGTLQSLQSRLGEIDEEIYQMLPSKKDEWKTRFAKEPVPDTSGMDSNWKQLGENDTMAAIVSQKSRMINKIHDVETQIVGKTSTIESLRSHLPEADECLQDAAHKYHTTTMSNRARAKTALAQAQAALSGGYTSYSAVGYSHTYFGCYV